MCVCDQWGGGNYSNLQWGMTKISGGGRLKSIAVNISFQCT